MTRRCSAPNAAGVALAAAIGLPPMPGLAQTAGPGSDLLQPSLDGNPANPPRFRQPGEAAPPWESTASPRHIHRDLPPWRDADLWQPGRFRGGRYRLRFQEYAAAQKISANAAVIGWRNHAATRNDFRAGAELHVPRNVQACRAEKADAAGDPSEQGGDTDRRGVAAAARAAAVEQSAAGGTSVEGGQPPRRRLARPAAAIFRLRGEHPAADDAAAQYAHAGNPAAAAAADRRRRSLCGAWHPRRLVPVAAVARSDRRL